MQKLLIKKRNKGFTLIELIVVIAVIAILVLLATPKFLDYTRDAKIAQIKNDVKVAEEIIEKYLFDNHTLPDTLEPVDMFLETMLLRAFDTKGLAIGFESGDYKNITGMSEIQKMNSKLPGLFVSNSNGKVYYVHDTTLSGIELPDPGDNVAEDGTIIDDSLITGLTPISDPSIIEEAIENAPIEMDRDGDGDVDSDDFVTDNEYINGYEVRSGVLRYFLYDRANTPRAVLIEYLGDYDYSAKTWSKSKEITLPSVARPITLVGNIYNYGMVGFLAVGTIDDNALNADVTGHVLDKIEFSALSNIEVIGSYAFANNNLTEINLPVGLKVIGSYAFYDNNIENMSYYSADVFGESSFEWNKLASVVINYTVKSIEDRAFANNKRDGEPSITMIRKSIDKISPPRNYAEAINSSGDAIDEDGNKFATIYNAAMGNGVFTGSTASIAANPFPLCDLSTLTTYTAEITSTRQDEFLVQVVDYEQDEWLSEYPREEFVDNILYSTENYEYGINISNPDTVSIVNYLGSETDIVIPGIINGKYVTRITGPEEWSGAFESRDLTSVVLPCTISEIVGEYAFYDNYLTEINLHEGITKIGYSAFDENDDLEEIDLPETLEYIGPYAIGYGITSIHIPKNVGKIEYSAFFYSRINTITVDPENLNYMSDHNGLYSKDGKTIYYGNSDTFNNLLPTTEHIAYYAFFDKNINGSITIPDSVKIIGKQAFFRNQITSVEIPSGVAEIRERAFAENKVTFVDLSDINPIWGDGVFASNSITDFVLSTNMTTIPKEMFQVNYITNLVIPEWVTTIKANAFAFNLIEKAIIHPSIETIEYYGIHIKEDGFVELDGTPENFNGANFNTECFRYGYRSGTSFVLTTGTVHPIYTKATQLKDVAIKSTVRDSSWSHNSKIVDWKVMAKNHPGYPDGSVTLTTIDIIEQLAYDNSTNRGSSSGHNHWRDSGTGNATIGIRKFLNGSSYSGSDINIYSTPFYDSFSSSFKSKVLTTNLVNVTSSNSVYYTNDKVFLPSLAEVGSNYDTQIYRVGTYWGSFTSYYKGSSVELWTRSPRKGYVNGLGRVTSTGSGYSNPNIARGIKPAINMNQDTPVEYIGNGVFKLFP